MAIGNYLTTKEAAEALGVSPIRVRQFATEGRLPAQRVGINLLFQRQHVELFRKKPRQTGRPKQPKK